MARSTSLVITQHIETIGETPTFTVEVNMVSKKGAPSMFDLRLWDKSTHLPMNGVFLRDEEVIRLRDLLNDITLPEEQADKL